MLNTKIKCELCGVEMHCITPSHLKKHHTNVTQYKIQFPNSELRSEISKQIKSDSAKKANKNRVGIKRTKEVIDKIKKTKHNNKKSAWNKGIAMSDKQKKQLSISKKLYYSKNTTTHWNVGNKTKSTTKTKISKSLIEYNKPQQLKKQQYKTKQKQLIQSQIDNLQLQLLFPLILTLPVTHNSIRLLQSIITKQDRIKHSNCALINIVITNKKEHKYVISCNVCNYEWNITGQYFTNCKYTNIKNKLCPECFPRTYNVSVGEIELRDYLISLNFNVTQDRTILNGLEIDCYIKNKKIGFEYNGLYWHSEGLVDKNKMLEKTKVCNDKNVKLIHIFEDEWINKRDICKSRISAILGKYDRVFNGRDIKISTIDHTLKNNFLKHTHIQGTDISSINIGAFYKNELVAAMTFKPTNTSKGGDGNRIELSRFSCALNTKIHGVASKLFKFYLKNYNSSVNIISYSDIRWNTGAVYKAMGFKMCNNTPIGYWYFDPNKLIRLHRSNFMKHKLSNQGLPAKIWDKNLSEKQMMDKWGKYLRIWDCGHYKYVYER